jgi:hypothetical protein
MDEEKKELFALPGWSAADKALLADLAEWDQEAHNDEDFELLAMIVDEAARGVDIPERYPAYWAKMKRSAELREAFLDCLEFLEASRGGRLRSDRQPMPPWPLSGTRRMPD